MNQSIDKMTAAELIGRYGADMHVENGLFVECHYPAEGEERPASGSMYYYVRPGEKTRFHSIDCDEYWSYNAGSTLELWVVGLDGRLSIRRCGITEGGEPTIRLAAGEIFASRLDADALDGTFMTCITVPRFTYEGFRLFNKEDVISLVPEAAAFCGMTLLNSNLSFSSIMKGRLEMR